MTHQQHAWLHTGCTLVGLQATRFGWSASAEQETCPHSRYVSSLQHRFIACCDTDQRFRMSSSHAEASVDAEENNAAFQLASAAGDVEAVRALLALPPGRGVRPAANSNYAFRQACEGGHLGVVQALLALPRERGVDPAANDNYAFDEACRNGHLDVVQALLALPLERGVRTGMGMRGTDALYEACERGQVELVRVLLTSSLSRFDANYAFFVACENGHADVVQLLLALPPEAKVNPADPYPGELYDYCGNESSQLDALAAASSCGHAEVVRILLSLPPERGVDASSEGYTAIHEACAGHHLEVVRLLLPHIPDSVIIASFRFAYLCKQWDVVALLIDQDLDLSHEDWLELQGACVADGQVELLAHASYLQRRDAFLAHQFTCRR